MKKIVILSGKGGVGKSSVVASLAVLLARNRKIIAVDCDVDASNLALVLGLRTDAFESWHPVQTSEKALLVPEKCTHCEKCKSVCNFNAISWDEKKGEPIFNELLCEGCGACQLVCDAGAIELKKVDNAKVGFGRTKYGFYIVSGQLKMGEAGSGKVVSVVKDRAYELAKKEEAEIILIDSAAGIGCPVIASVRDADYGVVVTEPTPSAFSDMKRALSVLNHFGIKYGIIINRYDINTKLTETIEKFANEHDLPILGKIPYDRTFVDALVNLIPIVIYDKKYEKLFSEILAKIVNQL